MKTTDELQTRIAGMLKDEPLAHRMSDQIAGQITSIVAQFYGRPAIGSFEDGRRFALGEAINAVNQAAKDAFRSDTRDTAASLQRRVLDRLVHIRAVSISGAPATEDQNQADLSYEDIEANEIIADLRMQLKVAQEEADYWRTSSPQSIVQVRQDAFSDVSNMMQVAARQKVQLQRREVSEEFRVMQRAIDTKMREAGRVDSTHMMIHAEAVAERPTSAEPWKTSLQYLDEAHASFVSRLFKTSVPFYARRAANTLLKTANGVFAEQRMQVEQAAQYDAQQSLEQAKKERIR